MKKIITIGLLVVASLAGYSQESYKWEKVDSTSIPKDQEYIKTKNFIILDKDNIIKIDDKENGEVVVRGKKTYITKVPGGYYNAGYTYTYLITFKFKEFKSKVNIDNVVNISTSYEISNTGATLSAANSMVNGTTNATNAYGFKPVIVQPNDEFPGVWKTGIKKTQYDEMIKNLKSDLQNIVDSYSEFIKNSKDDSNW